MAMLAGATMTTTSVAAGKSESIRVRKAALSNEATSPSARITVVTTDTAPPAVVGGVSGDESGGESSGASGDEGGGCGRGDRREGVRRARGGRA